MSLGSPSEYLGPGESSQDIAAFVGGTGVCGCTWDLRVQRFWLARHQQFEVLPRPQGTVGWGGSGCPLQTSMSHSWSENFPQGPLVWDVPVPGGQGWDGRSRSRIRGAAGLPARGALGWLQCGWDTEGLECQAEDLTLV